MVYVQNGRVLQEKPFGLKTITDFFWGIILFVIYFFRTLLGLESGRNNDNGGYRPGGRGGGPGGGGGGPGGGPRRPRTIGRVTTIQDCSMPGGG
ncbi:hypothetical protein Trydic_g23974 [Trypoxylus dichotomus]